MEKRKKKAQEEAKPYTHTRNQEYAPILPQPHAFTTPRANTITTAVVIQGLGASAEGCRHVVRDEQSCEENTDAQGEETLRESRQCGSTLTQSPHTHPHALTVKE